jgi:hypothetical protein
MLLEVTLPHVSKAAADAAFVSSGLCDGTALSSTATAGASTVASLLRLLGSSCVPAADAAVADGAVVSEGVVASPQGYGAGHVALTLRGFLVGVVRAMLLSSEWNAAVLDAVTNALSAVGRYIPLCESGGEASSADVSAAAGAAFQLACGGAVVLGGGRDTLRVGALVVTEQVLRETRSAANPVAALQRAGTVVRYSRGSALAAVLYDASAPPVMVDVDTLVPLDSMPLPYGTVTLTPALLAALKAVLEATVSVPLPAEDAVQATAAAADGGKGGGATAGKTVEAPPRPAQSPAFEQPSVDTVADAVTAPVHWLSTLQHLSVSCLAKLVDSHAAAAAVVDAGLLPSLLRRSLQDVRLPAIVDPLLLADRGNLLLERVLEWRGGTQCGSSAGAGAGERAMTEAELMMRQSATELSFLGFEFDLCLKGLELKGGDMERAAEWLLSGEVRLRHVCRVVGRDGVCVCVCVCVCV